MNKTHNYKRILIVRLDRIGDVVLSTPTIKAVRIAYPESHIGVVVSPYARDIIEGSPDVDEVIVYDKKGPQRGLLGNFKFIQSLRKKRFDLAIILHPTARTHLVTFMAGIPERVGYDRKLGFLLTKRIPHTKQFGLKHEIDYTLDILRYIGIEPKRSPLFMPLGADCEQKVEEIFLRNGIRATDKVIVLNPAASCPSKRWRPERFAKVAARMAEKYGAKIVVISDTKDIPFGDKVASAMMTGCVNLSGKTSVGEVASILKRAKLLISNDSGPVHIACAVGTPVVAIFGRRDRGLAPARWGPTGKNDIVLHKDVGCEVCLAHNCEAGFKCLEAITVDEVLNAADKLLAGG